VENEVDTSVIFFYDKCRLIWLQSDLLLRINTEIRWTSLNRKNLNLLTIMSIVMKTPLTLKFSDNLIINYAVGLKVSIVLFIHIFVSLITFSDC
jgi:hypothetical protein